MDLHKFVQSDIVQLAVIVSGLLTLVLIGFQAWKAFLVPLVERIRVGRTAARERAASDLARHISLAVNWSAYCQAHLALLAIRVQLAVATIIFASFATLFGSMLYVPGVAERGGWVMSPGPFPPSDLIIASVTLILLAGSLLLKALSDARAFARGVRNEVIKSARD